MEKVWNLEDYKHNKRQVSDRKEAPAVVMTGCG